MLSVKAEDLKKVETILLVEDEVLIRMDLSDFLRECGFQVIEAASAAEAIAVIEADADIDLVFSDVQMPGDVDGFGLATWIRRNRPELPVILTSGIVRSVNTANELCEIGPIEGKPFHPQKLLERLRETLAKAKRKDGV